MSISKLYLSTLLEFCLIILSGCKGKQENSVVKQWQKARREKSVVTNSIGMKLVYIPSGEFMIGWPAPVFSTSCYESISHLLSSS